MSDTGASGRRDVPGVQGSSGLAPSPAGSLRQPSRVPGSLPFLPPGRPAGLPSRCHHAFQKPGSAAAAASAAAHPATTSRLWSRAHFGLCVPRLTGSEPLTILPLTLEPEAVAQAHYKACDRLKLERKQRRMCRRDPGVAETLVEAVSMSALECQYQFRFERWNCTLEGRYRASLLKRGECARPLDGCRGRGSSRGGAPQLSSGGWAVGFEPAAPHLRPPALSPTLPPQPTPAWNSCWWHRRMWTAVRGPEAALTALATWPGLRPSAWTQGQGSSWHPSS